MEEMAASYKGPHRVVLNRNDPNRGLAGHLNYIGEIMRGGFLVIAAGDDISLPHRTKAIYEQGIRSQSSADLIYSAATEITEDGKELYLRDATQMRQRLQGASVEQVIQRNSYTLGATCVISARMLKEFPPLMKGLICEDHLWPMRALLLGGKIQYVTDALVRHRCDGIGSRLPSGVRVKDYEQKIIDLKSRENWSVHLEECEKQLFFWKVKKERKNGKSHSEVEGSTVKLLCWYCKQCLKRWTKRQLGKKFFNIYLYLRRESLQ